MKQNRALKQVQIKPETVAVLKVKREHGQSVKAKMEAILDDWALEFYQECADREGVELLDWIDKASRGEF